ncbi:DUF2250 domain-containing protein [Halegenticoccus soli]|uniref:DUF2250 domain-containing protein n=1 Tax=Halegenticoccus soli TaxID=1985678 RepID=UPI000C6E9E85|nr:DUF2250 domain-containing protein [Halegenticoccus soli]
MTQSTAEDLQPADLRILRVLRSQRVEYPALIASQTGLHFPVVEQRCDYLEESGYIESVSEEVLYRITSRGERCLADA